MCKGQVAACRRRNLHELIARVIGQCRGSSVPLSNGHQLPIRSVGFHDARFGYGVLPTRERASPTRDTNQRVSGTERGPSTTLLAKNVRSAILANRGDRSGRRISGADGSVQLSLPVEQPLAHAGDQTEKHR